MQQCYTSRNYVKGILWALPQKFYRFGKKIVINVCECKQGELFLFSNNFVETCSYALEIFRNIDIRHLFNFKGYFYVFDTFHKYGIQAHNLMPRLKHI